MDAPKKFDYTMMSTFLRCPKRYYFRMVRHLVGLKPPTAAEFGRCIHAALDTWFATHDKKLAKAVFEKIWPETMADNKRNLAVGLKLLDLYAEKYDHEGFKVLATEQTFDLPLFDDINLVGRIDKIIDWGGAIYVLDHKTTSRLGYEYFYKIKPNIQFDGYIYAAKKLGYDKCDGVVLDALLVAKGLLTLSQLAKLTPLARDISERTEKDLKKYLRNVRRIIDNIERGYSTGVWIENTEGCCDFGECPYRRLCKEDEDLHERIMTSEYRVEPWDPLESIEVKV